MPVGAHPPSGCISNPAGVATDSYGNVYVASAGPEGSLGDSGRIDIFDSSGYFITEVLDNNGPGSIAVDSKGTLYVANRFSDQNENVVRYSPTVYEPAEGKIEYADPPLVLIPLGYSSFMGVDVDRATDRLFVKFSSHVTEYKSAAEGNAEVDSFGLGLIEEEGLGIAVDAAHGRVYASSYEGPPGGKKEIVRVFDRAAPHSVLYKIDDSLLPSGHFSSFVPLAVDEGTGNLFVYSSSTKEVYEFATSNHDATYLATIKFGFQEIFGPSITIDNGAHSPNGALNPRERYLFVPSNPNGVGHSYAFGPPSVGKPEIKSISFLNVGEGEAELRASVEPYGLQTHYAVQYTTKAAFDATGFEGALIAGEGDIRAGAAPVKVIAPAIGLSPGTAYRFRVVATNAEGSVESERSFMTYPASARIRPCPNDPLRTGPSALLPDCRAYELVTPANTNAHVPLALGHYGTFFPTRTVSPTGETVSFLVEGGAIPGYEGTSGFSGDRYVATRGPTGWETVAGGPTGAEAPRADSGSASPDQGYSFWSSAHLGSRLRYPDGHSEQLGRGSLGVDPRSTGRFISAGGQHVIFSSGPGDPAIQLEPNAPPSGTIAIYDRTIDPDTGAEQTHVISLLPGDVAQAAGQNAGYDGASANGRAVAFNIGSRLYLRYGDERTYAPDVPDARSGRQLTCEVDQLLAGASPSYEWLLDGAPIFGATSPTYTPIASQAGSLVQCLGHASNSEGGAIAASAPLLIDHTRAAGSPPRPAVVSVMPNEPTAGQTAQCQAGAWSGEPSLSYQWLRNGSVIVGATASSYLVQAADEHVQLQCEVEGQANGAAAIAVSKAVEVEPPNPPSWASSLPSISNQTHANGATEVGDELSCSEGGWGGSPTVSYAWLRNGAPIAGQADPAYVVVAEDEGKPLQCEVVGETPDGVAVAVSVPLAVSPLAAGEMPAGAVSVKGVHAVGQTLECEAGQWRNAPDLTYRWLRNGTPIGGASTSTYLLSAEDRETVVQCELTATGSAGSVLALGESSYVNAKPAPNASAPGQPWTFAGLSQDGAHLFYTQAGDIWRFDREGEGTTRFTDLGNVTVVNVSADGTTAYFVSPTALGVEPSPTGALPVPGEQNLYRTREGMIDFVGTVTERDVEGIGTENVPEKGLGRWTTALRLGMLVRDPSRISRDGSVLLFEARTPLTDFDPQGHVEVYRYEADASTASTLRCLSCNPTGLATGEATLASPSNQPLDPEPLNDYGLPENLAAGGGRAFFQSTERLAVTDTDGRQDVYEWEENGSGACQTPGGCLYLLSSGSSAEPDYLVGVSETGDDVIISSSDLLAPAEDPDETASFYDVRVNGGFQHSAPPAECLGEACQPAARQPFDPTVQFAGAGNAPKTKHPPRCRARSKAGPGTSDGRAKGRCGRSHAKHRHKAHHRRHRGAGQKGRGQR